MPKISNSPIPQGTWSRFLDDFYIAIASLENEEEIRGFLNQILTKTERLMLAKRFQIAIMLLLGYDYALIKIKAKVGNSTIANINNLLNENSALEKTARNIIKLKKDKLSSHKSSSFRVDSKSSLTPKTLGGALIKTGIKAGADLLAARITKTKRIKNKKLTL